MCLKKLTRPEAVENYEREQEFVTATAAQAAMTGDYTALGHSL